MTTKKQADRMYFIAIIMFVLGLRTQDSILIIIAILLIASTLTQKRHT